MDDALSLEGVEAAAVAALLGDPAWEVGEGVAVGVGGDVDDLAEPLGYVSQGHGGLVGRAARGLVVEVPEDHDFVGLGGVDAFSVLDHVDIFLGVVVGGGFDVPARAGNCQKGFEGEGMGRELGFDFVVGGKRGRRGFEGEEFRWVEERIHSGFLIFIRCLERERKRERGFISSVLLLQDEESCCIGGNG